MRTWAWGNPWAQFRQIYGPHLQHILQDTNSRAEDPGPPRTVSPPPQPDSYNAISDCSGCLGRICQSPVSCREILATRPDHESSWKICPLSLKGFYFLFFYFILFLNFTILYWFCQISKWIRHRYTRVPHPEPSSLLPSLPYPPSGSSQCTSPKHPVPCI